MLNYAMAFGPNEVCFVCLWTFCWIYGRCIAISVLLHDSTFLEQSCLAIVVQFWDNMVNAWIIFEEITEWKCQVLYKVPILACMLLLCTWLVVVKHQLPLRVYSR